MQGLAGTTDNEEEEEGRKAAKQSWINPLLLPSRRQGFIGLSETRVFQNSKHTAPETDHEEKGLAVQRCFGVRRRSRKLKRWTVSHSDLQAQEQLKSGPFFVFFFSFLPSTVMMKKTFLMACW